jgi:hypothetical protein
LATLALAGMTASWLAGAPPGSAAAGPDGGLGLDARRIMEAVNARYQEKINQPRVVRIDGTSAVRGLDQFTIVTVAEELAWLQGDKARVEQVFSEVTVEGGGGEVVYQGPGASRQLWVHDGRETRMLYETPKIESLPGGTKVQGMVLRHHQIPQEFPLKFRQPLISNEFDRVFLDAGFYAYPAVFDSRTVFVLRSQQPIVVNASAVILASAFWIDAQLLEVVRIELEVQQADEEANEPVYLSTVQDLQTTWGEPIPASHFELELPGDAKDVTPGVIDALRESGFASGVKEGGTP